MSHPLGGLAGNVIDFDASPDASYMRRDLRFWIIDESLTWKDLRRS